MKYARRGRTITSKGYVRLTKKPNRFKYEHRVVAAALIEASHPLTKSVLQPFETLTVHHFDGRKDHNCPRNLMILDSDIHNGITQQSKVPDWVLDTGVYCKNGYKNYQCGSREHY